MSRRPNLAASPRRRAAPESERLFGLDLVRALAIGGVVMAHTIMVTPARWAAEWREVVTVGGFGVDVFFALSGYLIAGQLYDDWGAARLPVREFWVRRWLRTLPGYFVFLVITHAIDRLFGRPPEPFDWRFLGHLQFAREPFPILFGESWSLAVEEWFYLLFPLVLFGARSCGIGRARAFGIAVALLGGVAIVHRFSMLHAVSGFDTLRRLTFGRLDAIAMGVAIVVADRGGFFRAAGRRLAAALVGMMLCMAAMSALDAAGGLFPRVSFLPPDLMMVRAGAPTVFGIGAALLLPAAARLETWRWARAVGAVRFIARISYSMYLANLTVAWGVTTFCAHLPLPLAGAVLLYVVLTLLVGWTSYECVERPFIAWYRRRLPRRGPAVFGAAASKVSVGAEV